MLVISGTSILWIRASCTPSRDDQRQLLPLQHRLNQPRKKHETMDVIERLVEVYLLNFRKRLSRDHVHQVLRFASTVLMPLKQETEDRVLVPGSPVSKADLPEPLPKQASIPETNNDHFCLLELVWSTLEAELEHFNSKHKPQRIPFGPHFK